MTETVDLFDDARLASVYDDLNPWGAWDDFYLGLAREGGRGVLDLGCGTGRLACRIAAEGYDVVGAEPAAGMIGVARARPGAEAATPTAPPAPPPCRSARRRGFRRRRSAGLGSGP